MLEDLLNCLWSLPVEGQSYSSGVNPVLQLGGCVDAVKCFAGIDREIRESLEFRFTHDSTVSIFNVKLAIMPLDNHYFARCLGMARRPSRVGGCFGVDL